MNLENQTDIDTYNIQHQNGLSQEKKLILEEGFSQNSAWNQLLKWSKANPELMINYINYPLEQKDKLDNFYQKQHSASQKCSQFNGEISDEAFVVQKFTSKNKDIQKFHFEFGDFDDEDLNFDNKKISYSLNNYQSFDIQVDKNIQFRQEENKQVNESFFKKTFSEDSEPNGQSQTQIDFNSEIPIRQKKSYRNIDQNQQQYKTEKKWNKKMSKKQIKNSLNNSLNKEEEFQKLLKLDKNQQIAYVQNRLRHYNLLKSMIIKMNLKDDKIHKVVTLLQNDKISAKFKENKNESRTDEYQIQSFDKKMNITPQLLRMLSGKFQLFKNYQMGKYEPGYKMSLASIANQFQLSSQTVSNLYFEWRTDPGFIRKIQNPNSFDEKQSLNNQLSQNNAFRLKYHTSKKQISPLFHQISNKNACKILQIRKIFSERFRKLKSKGARLYFLDECPKEMIMGTNRVEEQTQCHLINFSLMTLLGLKGRASWKVVRWLGQKYQQINDIQQLYKNVRDDEQVSQSQNLKSSKSYLILDATVVKSTEKIARIQQITKSKILFFPQFSKQLNPLQFWFTDVKVRLRMVNKSLNELNKVLQKISDTDFGKYLSDSERYMTFALQKKAF